MKEKLISVIQALLLIAAIYVAYLYYTRPEMVVDYETFRSAAENQGYRVTKLKKNDSELIDATYLATDERGIKIYYIQFKTDIDAQNYYKTWNEKINPKYSLRFSRDIRYKKPSAEKQTYMNQYRFFGSLYAKDAVITSDVLLNSSGPVKQFIDGLFIPPKFKLGEFEI